MVWLQRFGIWLNYIYNGKTRYLIHSPFVFNFINEVLRDNRQFYAFELVDALRRKSLKDKRVLNVVELGAGKGKGTSSKKTVATLTKNTAITPKYGQLLFRMVDYFQPEGILEVGTGLGFATAYLSMAKPSAKTITLEGNRAIAQVAEEHFISLGINSIEIIRGNFDDSLQAVLARNKPLGMVFIDGNHTAEATLRYFNQCLPHCNQHTILVFDDINWSADMQKAWKEIRQHEKVTLSIDLFRMGLIFFTDEIKQPYHMQLYY